MSPETLDWFILENCKGVLSKEDEIYPEEKVRWGSFGCEVIYKLGKCVWGL